jgi:ornithine cyclodeaminase/alanine dehydrogenase-like protein (mu-crystallin family)
MIWLGEEDVERLLDPVALVAAIEAGFGEAAINALIEPPASRIDGLGEGTSYLTVFPSYRRAAALATAKVLAGRRDNPSFGRPEIDAVVVVADARSAHIKAIVSARAMTALRTAATTAVAIRHLRREVAPGVVGLVGTGAQGRAHARVLAATGLAASLLVAAPVGGLVRAARFAAEVSAATALAVRPATVAEVVGECDVVVTATLSGSPLVGANLGREALLASVGPFYPGETEIEPGLCRQVSLLLSDHPERLRRQWESVPGVIPEQVAALSDLVAGEVRRPPAGQALFLSDGRALEDNIAAGLVLEAAERAGCGCELGGAAIRPGER